MTISEKKYPKLPKRMKEERIRLGLSKTEFAKIAGLSPSQVSKYESGKEVPRKESALKICRIAQISYEYLFGLTDERKQNEKMNIWEEVLGLIDHQNPILNIKTLKNKNSPDNIKTVNIVGADFAVSMPNDTMYPLINKGSICYGKKGMFLQSICDRSPIGYFPPINPEDKPLIRKFVGRKYKGELVFVLEPINRYYDPIVLDFGTFKERYDKGGLITYVLNYLDCTAFLSF